MACEFAAVGKFAENGIFGDDGGMGAERAAVADVFFRAVIPRAPGDLFADPAGAHWLGIKPAAGRAVVFFCRPPETVTALGSAAVDQRPGTEAGSVTQTEIGRRGFGEIKAVIQNAPTAHLRHVAEQVVE